MRVHCINFHQKIPIVSSDKEQNDFISVPTAVSTALGAVAWMAPRAFAVEATSTKISPGDVEILAANSTGSGVDQVVVSVLFGVVAFLLVVVTGGVSAGSRITVVTDQIHDWTRITELLYIFMARVAYAMLIPGFEFCAMVLPITYDPFTRHFLTISTALNSLRFHAS